MSYEYQQRDVPKQPEKEFILGKGRISGFCSAFLGGLSLLAVLAYLFPAYLTTAELRNVYDPLVLQQVLKYGMWFSLFLGGLTFVLNSHKWLGFFGVSTTFRL